MLSDYVINIMNYHNCVLDTDEGPMQANELGGSLFNTSQSFTRSFRDANSRQTRQQTRLSLTRRPSEPITSNRSRSGAVGFLQRATESVKRMTQKRTQKRKKKMKDPAPNYKALVETDRNRRLSLQSVATREAQSAAQSGEDLQLSSTPYVFDGTA